MKAELPVTTSNGFENAEVVQYLGVVRGIVVRATGIGRDILGGLRGKYQFHALRRLLEQAKRSLRKGP